METEGAAGADTGTETGAADAGAGLAPAQTGTAQTTQTGPINFEELHAKAEAGEEIPEEHYEQYEKWLLESGKSTDPAQSQPEASQGTANAPGGKEQAGQTPDMQALMAEVGAKTPEEVQSKVRELRNTYSQTSERAKKAEKGLEEQSKLLEDLIDGKPEAWQWVKEKTGKDFPTPGKTPQAQESASPFTIPEEEIGESGEIIDTNLARRFNEILQKQQSYFDGKLQELSGKMGNIGQYETMLQEQRRSAQVAEIESRVTDSLVSLAEKNADVYGLAGKPVRTLIEQWRRDPANPPPELAELISTASLYADLAQSVHDGRLTMSLEDIHRIRHFDKINGRVAQAKIEAAANASSRAQNVKPTAGVAGGAAPKREPSCTDADIKAMIAGSLDIPDEWMDDGMPSRDKMPSKLYEALTKV